MKTTITNWMGDASINLEFLPSSDGEPLVSISQASESLSFFFAMNEAGLSKLICDAIHIRNLMRVQPPVIPGLELESGEFIPADQLNKARS